MHTPLNSHDPPPPCAHTTGHTHDQHMHIPLKLTWPPHVHIPLSSHNPHMQTMPGSHDPHIHTPLAFSLVPRPHPQSRRESEDFERFLCCAESVVMWHLILVMHIIVHHARIIPLNGCWLSTTKKSLETPQTLSRFVGRVWTQTLG